MNKAARLTKNAIASMTPSDQRHYAVFLYMKKHNTTMAKAYQAIYNCSPESAQAASSRLAKSDAWLDLSRRMEEASLQSKFTIKTEITAAMLDILHNPKAFPGDKAKAAAQLAQIFDLNNHTVTLQVDAVTKYAEQSLALSSNEPLVTSGEVIDVEVDSSQPEI